MDKGRAEMRRVRVETPRQPRVSFHPPSDTEKSDEAKSTEEEGSCYSNESADNPLDSDFASIVTGSTVAPVAQHSSFASHVQGDQNSLDPSSSKISWLS